MHPISYQRRSKDDDRGTPLHVAGRNAFAANWKRRDLQIAGGRSDLKTYSGRHGVMGSERVTEPASAYDRYTAYSGQPLPHPRRLVSSTA